MALVALIVGFAANYYAPVSWNFAIYFYQVPDFFFYGIVAAAAVVAVREGNRSAWFVGAGTVLLIITLLLLSVAEIFPLAAGWLADLWSFAIASDMMLFILGVGDRLRQTSLAYQRALREKDAAQAALVSEQRVHLADVERRNASFGHFVPREFLEQLGKPDIVDVALGDHVERSMTVLFSDIRGFMSIAERLSPAQTFEFLNAYLARAGPAVREHGGFIDKYVGDAIVALFPEHPSDALDAAIALQNEVRRFNEERARKGYEPIAVGVGVHFGQMMLGTIGEAERFETTVIADSVNVASRLEGLTKIYGVSIVTSASLVNVLAHPKAYCLRPLGEVSLRGHEGTESAFEVFDGDPHELVLHKRRTLPGNGIEFLTPKRHREIDPLTARGCSSRRTGLTTAPAPKRSTEEVDYARSMGDHPSPMCS